MKHLQQQQIKYIREDPGLREQEFAGGFQTGQLAWHERDQYSKFSYRWNKGESAADVFDRISVFIGAMWREFESDYFGKVMNDNGSIIIFTHGLTLRVFLMRFVHHLGF